MMCKGLRSVAALGVVALLAGALAVPSGASTRRGAPVQGVTDDEIQVMVIAPDLDLLRSRGINFSPKLTNAYFAKRIQAYADAFGPVNGREVVTDVVGWTPGDPTSFQTTCTKAAVDNKPFVVINTSGFRSAYIPCITVENNTPFISGDPGYGDVMQASGNKLFHLGLPSEVTGKTTARFVDQTKLIPKSAKIGIVSNNDPQIKAASDVLESELEKRGYNVARKVELNGLGADPTALNRESSTAATTFQADGIDTVFLPQSFTPLAGFFDEVVRSGANFKLIAMDGQSDVCTMNSASRTPAAAAGIPCITANGGPLAADAPGAVRPDNAFEAKCREEYDAAMGYTTQPGGPNGDSNPINGVVYTEDFAQPECTIMGFLMPALKKAGKNLTWDKVAKALEGTKSGGAAYLSDGDGGFGKNKRYWANQVHLATLTAANASTAKDSNGVTWNGCTMPINCWVPQELDGREWYPTAEIAKNEVQTSTTTAAASATTAAR